MPDTGFLGGAMGGAPGSGSFPIPTGTVGGLGISSPSFLLAAMQQYYQQQGNLALEPWKTLQAIIGSGFQSQENVNTAKGEFGGAEGELGGEQSWMKGIRDTGLFSPEMIQSLGANASRQVTDQSRAVASNAYGRSMGRQADPFAAMAIMSKGSNDAGRARADVMTGLTKENQYSKMAGAEGLMKLLGIQTDIAGSKAGLDMKVLPNYIQSIMNGLGTPGAGGARGGAGGGEGGGGGGIGGLFPSVPFGNHGDVASDRGVLY